ncbi:MAG TPA: phosphoribosyl-AMP cyclohydrolase, partial [Candidatus Altiarchaeales archaeon]|nr:phosphoribosyl-AMP cyclohydrolase [Candidatus Altiarchaeales archaeon]
MDFLQELKARSVDGIGGLYVVITQDAKTRDVLMQAFADREAVEKTVETGLAHYYSTSRRKLWLKGESSGNTQKVVEMLVDCDADAIIY